MSEWKITASHLRRPRSSTSAVTLAQVERNRESTARQYDLAARARELGWPASAVTVIDEDLGISGRSAAGRAGFADLASQVGLGQVGIVLSLECSRLARNNSDWYRLLDLAGMTDTLIADADGVYHPAMFNDRLLLGMKGTMAESELHVLRSRLDGGIRNKAARGELRRALPAGLVSGRRGRGSPPPSRGGRPRRHHRDLRAVRRPRLARAVWLHLREEGLKLPLQRHGYLTAAQAARQETAWAEPTYHAVHNVLTHPGYAGAYTDGRTRQEKKVPATHRADPPRRTAPGPVGSADQRPPRGIHQLEEYQGNQAAISRNTRPQAHQPGTGAVREGSALLQGLATCGTCGRKLAVYYEGKHKAVPGDHRTGTGTMVEGRGTRHLRAGGGDRHGRRRRVPGRARARRAASLPGRRRADRAGPRRGPGRAPPPGRGRPLRGGEGRTPLPGRRPGEPARGPRPGIEPGRRQLAEPAAAEAEPPAAGAAPPP